MNTIRPFPPKPLYFFQFSKKVRGDSPSFHQLRHWYSSQSRYSCATFSPDHYGAKCSWWIKQKTYCVGKVVILNWLVCFGVLSATYEALISVVNFYQFFIVWWHHIMRTLPVVTFCRAWRIENLGARFFVYANTGLRTRRARSQFHARELPVHARVYADRVRHQVSNEPD